MLAFIGFNGFGQFGGSGEMQTMTFQSVTIADLNLENKDDLLISCSWSYNAYATGNVVILQGLLAGKSNSKICVPTKEPVQQIAACDRYCLVLLKNGKLFKLLPNLNGELSEIQFAEATLTRKRNIFGDLKPTETTQITHIALGNNIAVAISSTNCIFSIPSQIFQLPKHEKVKDCVCGFEHALLLTSNGDIYSWGNGIRGQLGVDPLEVHETLVLIDALAGIKIAAITAGGWHSAAISSFGDVYTWGFNSNGQLGLRLFKPNGLKAPSVYPLPQLLDLPECCMQENSICSPVKIWSGVRHLIVQMSCGSLMATGWRKHGQLGVFSKTENDYCDAFEKFNIEKNLIQNINFNIICGPWSTVVKTF